MANIKQIKMLLARSAEAGIKASWDQFAGLNNGEIDDKLAEYEHLKRGEMAGDGAHKPAKSNGFNEARFGMCCKIVIADTGVNWAIKERTQFASQVLSLFRSVDEAEKVVRNAPFELD